jgi:hypothetical protein
MQKKIQSNGDYLSIFIRISAAFFFSTLALVSVIILLKGELPVDEVQFLGGEIESYTESIPASFQGTP